MGVRIEQSHWTLRAVIAIATGGADRRRGAMLIMVAVVLTALIGMMALALEGGALMAERRHAQAIADASAMAAACDLTYNYAFNLGLDPQLTAKASALATAASCGYANDGITSTVTVSIPPVSGTYAGLAGYAQVQVLYNQQRGFSGIFGSGPLQVRASAVARGQWSTYPIAFLALEPVLPASLTVAANANVSVVNGVADVDSSSTLSTAIALTSRFSSPVLNLTGNYAALLNGSITGTVNTGVTPTPDPLAYLSPPNPATMTVQSSSLLTIAGFNPITLQPGVYNGGIRIVGTGKVTLSPGIYYMAGGGFTYASLLGNLQGSGVMIVNAPILPTDAISIAGSGSFQLTPPTSGLYTGITIMQPAELVSLPLGINPNLVIGANSLLGSTFSISGTIYAPQSIMALAGNGSAKVGSQVICRMAEVAANANVEIDWDKNTSRTPLPVTLVQ